MNGVGLREIKLYEPGSRPELFANKAIVLAASVPYRRAPKHLTSHEQQENEFYIRTSRPERIRAAIAEVCRATFSRGLNLIFGGHPAISPMVLHAAHRFARTEQETKRVIVFQSQHFLNRIPHDTLELGEWELGELLWTQARPGESEREAEAASLSWMRTCMMKSPGLLAAICIGGMEGVVQEAHLFREHYGGRPVIAIGSTGSAALQLLEKESALGKRADWQILAQVESYPIVVQRIFEDIEHW